MLVPQGKSKGLIRFSQALDWNACYQLLELLEPREERVQVFFYCQVAGIRLQFVLFSNS